MPNYTYLCSRCGCVFELFFHMGEYIEHPKCSSCTSKKTNRSYQHDMLTISASVKKSDSELKTIGDLANRNRDKLSQDEKDHLYHQHNKYKDTDLEKQLPKGMSRIKRPNKKNKWR